MLATITTKTLKDRWLGTVIGAGTLALILWFGMIVYQDIDLSIYTNMPDVFLSLMNIPKEADVGSLAYGAVYASYGALTLAALALSLGAASIAGEEKNGTIGLLLANPKSRTQVLSSKAIALVALAALGSVILWIAAVAVPPLVGVSVEGMHPGALVLHIFVNTLFYGTMAMAIGAWTGKTSVASGVTVTVMILSFVAAGLFPVIKGWEDLVNVSPWHYYDGSQPVFNGISWGDLAVLLIGIALFSAAGVVGVNRRDLHGQEVGTTLLDRLRTNPYTKKIAERLAGSARVSRISIKTVSDYQGITIITSYVMFLVMGILMGPLYGLMDEAVLSFASQLPDVLVAMIGGGDMATAEGFYQAETFSMMAPIAVMVVTVLLGSRALAGEESRRTMGLLMANPIPRSKVVVEKSLAMVVLAAIVGFTTFLGVVAGQWLGGLGMDIGHIGATSVLVTLLGLVFGAVALALSAATGRTKVAGYGATGLALVSYIVSNFLPLSDRLAPYAKWSPFYYYLGNDPLNQGMDWSHAGLLAALTIVLIALAVILFQRRDLRQSG